MIILAAVLILASQGCGGRTPVENHDASMPSDSVAGPEPDAIAADVPVSSPDAACIPVTTTCHGDCPQPNGTCCQSDCECQDKCVHGTCADSLVPAQSCGQKNQPPCPAGQECAQGFDVCQGQPCSINEDCPGHFVCVGVTCMAIGCI
jgi:hypothetical protein